MRTPQFFAPPATARLLQGLAAGVLATLVLGFTWGGWYTGGGATAKANAEVKEALVPICADMVMRDAAALADVKNTQRSDWDDAVIRNIKKVGDRALGTFDRPFAQACGVEVHRRVDAAAAAGKAAAK